jgi:hypothetical protein
MTTFKVREETNIRPDLMGDTYEFVKLSLDDFIAFVERLDRPVHRDVGPTELFLNETRPDHHWYVVSDRIYFTSNEPYPEDAYYVLDEDVVGPTNWPEPAGQEVKYRAGVRYLHVDRVHQNKFSETQKWVKKIEDWVMNHPAPDLSPAEIREMVRKATGK